MNALREDPDAFDPVLHPMEYDMFKSKFILTPS